MYQLLINELNGEISAIKHVETNTTIPMVESNNDYQEYLEWLAEGNTPLPAA
jgi:hypothetical protein